MREFHLHNSGVYITARGKCQLTPAKAMAKEPDEIYFAQEMTRLKKEGDCNKTIVTKLKSQRQQTNNG